MNPQDIEDLIERTGKKVADELMLKLGALGLNLEHPAQQRADFDHLRRWRKNVEFVGQASVSAFLMAAAGSVLTALYYGAKYMLGQGGQG